MNASWFKRYMNGFALFLTQTGGMSDEGIQKNLQSVCDVRCTNRFLLDIPDGVTVSNNPTATIRGIRWVYSKCFEGRKYFACKIT